MSLSQIAAPVAPVTIAETTPMPAELPAPAVEATDAAAGEVVPTAVVQPAPLTDEQTNAIINDVIELSTALFSQRAQEKAASNLKEATWAKMQERLTDLGSSTVIDRGPLNLKWVSAGTDLVTVPDEAAILEAAPELVAEIDRLQNELAAAHAKYDELGMKHVKVTRKPRAAKLVVAERKPKAAKTLATKKAQR